ncbi:kinase [Glaciecola siphonariae]|uniref:Kinase n=1 Tax=Glaciecola siphonariae TaxID=521012 RepID=A0ABV9LSX8_9ALTE
MIINDCLNRFIEDERLPVSFIHEAKKWYLPLLARLCDLHNSHQEGARLPLFVGINGAQGSGKSTLSALLVTLFRQVHKMNAVSMSLDDFYLTKSQRTHLAKTIHPLLQTRGVPGTHDLALMQQTLHALLQAQPCAIPKFDKASDDRANEATWDKITHSVDIIILEGWCVGAAPQSPEQLAVDANALESTHDSAHIWRNYVNNALKEDYQGVFEKLNYLIMLKAPSFEQIYQWRLEQERKMQQRNIDNGNSAGGMSPADIANFIQHYQRITEFGLYELPKRCNEVFELNTQRSIVSCRY